MKKFVTLLLLGTVLTTSTSIASTKNIQSIATTSTSVNGNIVSLSETVKSEEFRRFHDVGVDRVEGASLLMSKLQEGSLDETRSKMDFSSMIKFIQTQHDLAVTGTLKHSLSSSATVSETIDQVTDLVLSNLGLELTDKNKLEYRKVIKKAFIGLWSQEDEKWFHLSSANNENSSYSYFLMFVVERNGLLFTLPLELEVTANTSEFGILHMNENNTFNFDINLTGLKVLKMDI
ncbi:hypothetical protein [Longirhabdus pacifica]|uniref:hypothetical protein n=1 Tax=Longirhabdus pacifica TaxID=2305227 RepID=UPI0013E8CC11|nr:hypothetical protein [Longirhabdus pacifica]